MPTYEPGDYIKVEFRDECSGQSEWMWVRVDHADDDKRIVFGHLDNEPVVGTDLRLGTELAISFDNIREHTKSSAFSQEVPQARLSGPFLSSLRTARMSL